MKVQLRIVDEHGRYVPIGDCFAPRPSKVEALEELTTQLNHDNRRTCLSTKHDNQKYMCGTKPNTMVDQRVLDDLPSTKVDQTHVCTNVGMSIIMEVGVLVVLHNASALVRDHCSAGVLPP